MEPLRRAVAEIPAVCLLGPRQVGKTTLALDLAEPLGAGDGVSKVEKFLEHMGIQPLYSASGPKADTVSII